MIKWHANGKMGIVTWSCLLYYRVSSTFIARNSWQLALFTLCTHCDLWLQWRITWWRRDGVLETNRGISILKENDIEIVWSWPASKNKSRPARSLSQCAFTDGLDNVRGWRMVLYSQSATIIFLLLPPLAAAWMNRTGKQEAFFS